MSCFLLFLTLKKLFGSRRMSGKVRLWARVVDILSGAMYYCITTVTVRVVSCSTSVELVGDCSQRAPAMDAVKHIAVNCIPGHNP